ncbi:MAG TPA: hypothetical protein VKB79_11225 [Bryobacteraceae bacterium]|nr:hypothetical protein [Bryobacteraceae bacterium]
MVRSSLFLAVVIVAAVSFWLLGELSFLARYRAVIWHRHANALMLFAGAFTVNVFGAVLAINRRLFLRDTGKKLAHVEKQLRTGSSISEELTERLSE